MSLLYISSQVKTDGAMIQMSGQSFLCQSQLHFQLLHSPLNRQNHLQRVQLCLLHLLHPLIDLLRLTSCLLDLSLDLSLEQLQLTHQTHSILLRFLLQVAIHTRFLFTDALAKRDCTAASSYKSCSLSATSFSSFPSPSSLAKKLGSVLELCFWSEAERVWLALRVLLRLISKCYNEL